MAAQCSVATILRAQHTSEVCKSGPKNPFQCRAWQRGEVDEPRQVMPSSSSGLNITALTGPLQKQCAHGQSLALYFAAMTQIFVSAVWLDEAKTFLAIPIADLTVGISWPTMRTLQ